VLVALVLNASATIPSPAPDTPSWDKARRPCEGSRRRALSPMPMSEYVGESPVMRCSRPSASAWRDGNVWQREPAIWVSEGITRWVRLPDIPQDIEDR
jgi:hypothetical protein